MVQSPAHISVHAYAAIQKSTLRGATLEGRGFARAASLLREAREAPEDRGRAVAALRFNHQLWTIVQASLSSELNTVPARLKADLLGLSLFVDKRTTEALGNADARLLDALIDINRDLAHGLLGNEQQGNTGSA